MAHVNRIEPDLRFIRDLQAAGGESLKKCYQCATCSVVCPLSPEENPYPRKEMIWAQWGLKNKLVGDLDMWLCHNCGTCSDECPRGAKPADLMAAMRNMVYQNIAWPAIMGKLMSAPKYLPVLVAIPAMIFLVVWGLTTGLQIPAGEVLWRKVFPPSTAIYPIFGPISIAIIVIFVYGALSLIKTCNASPGAPVGGVSVMNVLKSSWGVIKNEILTHKRFKECGNNTDRYYGHLGIFFAFIGLFVTTSYLSVVTWLGVFTGLDLQATPMSLWNPFNILSNVASIALIVGLVLVTKRRLNLSDAKYKSSYYDWYLLGVVWVVALTGIFSQLLRLADAAWVAYPMYYLHLVSVFMLFAYLPWSKLAHLVYRTVALGYARAIGRGPKPQV